MDGNLVLIFVKYRVQNLVSVPLHLEIIKLKKFFYYKINYHKFHFADWNMKLWT